NCPKGTIPPAIEGFLPALGVVSWLSWHINRIRELLNTQATKILDSNAASRFLRNSVKKPLEKGEMGIC
ncbi:MAG TPA: hypothetical protein PL020_05985, partial [Candidatus Cloacimonadota bacterium]|nr:hypothetical protein [Candidatus Cloacimonadota bacterium]